jgi:hypothetical protein
MSQGFIALQSTHFQFEVSESEGSRGGIQRPAAAMAAAGLDEALKPFQDRASEAEVRSLLLSPVICFSHHQRFPAGSVRLD